MINGLTSDLTNSHFSAFSYSVQQYPWQSMSHTYAIHPYRLYLEKAWKLICHYIRLREMSSWKYEKQYWIPLTLKVLTFKKFTSYYSLNKTLMVGHGGSSAGSYLADPTSPIPSHCASIVVTSTLRVNELIEFHLSAVSRHGNKFANIDVQRILIPRLVRGRGKY